MGGHTEHPKQPKPNGGKAMIKVKHYGRNMEVES
jgi:hypothetical protein